MSNFNKELLSELLKKAKGNRSLNEFAKQADVDAGYISRLINKKREVPPTPEALKKIANSAHNEITYNALMLASGLIEYDNVIEDINSEVNVTISLDEEENYYVWMLKRLIKDGLIKSEDGIHISNEALELIKSAVKVDAKKIIANSTKSDKK